MARMFDKKSSNAPVASPKNPVRTDADDCQRRTKEMAIATPEGTAATSRRARAMAPAKPVATAAMRVE